MRTTKTVVDATTGETMGVAGASLFSATEPTPAYLTVFQSERVWHRLEASEVAEYEEMGETVRVVRLAA